MATPATRKVKRAPSRSNVIIARSRIFACKRLIGNEDRPVNCQTPSLLNQAKFRSTAALERIEIGQLCLGNPFGHNCVAAKFAMDWLEINEQDWKQWLLEPLLQEAERSVSDFCGIQPIRSHAGNGVARTGSKMRSVGTQTQFIFACFDAKIRKCRFQASGHTRIGRFLFEEYQGRGHQSLAELTRRKAAS